MQRVKDNFVLFEHPIAVQLVEHPVCHRVIGVKRKKNPNGIGDAEHCYAIAECFLNGKWLRLDDLALQMRLANVVEHDLGKNPEDYAIDARDKVIYETRFANRLVYHTPLGKTHLYFPIAVWGDSPEALGQVLDEFVATDIATGGHLEEFVDGIGWVVMNEQEEAA